MKLLTKPIREQLLKNGRTNGQRLSAVNSDGSTEDFKPVVKFFTPWSNCTWLLTELDREDADIAFGLCDLGMQCPEMGSVRISEIESISGPAGLKIERDLHFTADKTLTEYANEARKLGYIKA